MTNQDMDFLARKIVSLENKHNALARARQLPNSSVRLIDGSDVSMRDSIESGSDNRSAIEQLEGATTGIGSITDTVAENAVSVPDWFNELGVGVDVAWDSNQFLTDLSLELEAELGQAQQDLAQAQLDVEQAMLDVDEALQEAQTAIQVAGDANIAAAAATDAAAAAQTAANNAQTTANGKNKIVRSTTDASSPENYVAGDQWWKYSASQITAMWIHSGSAWVPQTLTDSVITNLNAGSITVGTIAADRLSATNIKSVLVSTGALEAANIATGAIIAVKMAANSITAANGALENLVVTNAKLDNLAVTEGKIGNLAVTTAKIANLAVSEAKIIDLSVSTAKIANLAVTDAKIGSLSAEKITAGTINADRIGADSITAAKISGGDFAGKTFTGGIFTGSTIRTAASGQRTQLDTIGLRTFNASGAETARIAADGSGLRLTGPLVSVDGSGTAAIKVDVGMVELTSNLGTGWSDRTVLTAYGLSTNHDSSISLGNTSNEAGTGAYIVSGSVPSNQAVIGVNTGTGATNSKITFSSVALLHNNRPVYSKEGTGTIALASGSSATAATTLWKDSDGVVWFNITITRTSWTTGGVTTLGTMPTGFRPAGATVTFPAITFGAGAPYNSFVQISTGGTIIANNSPTNGQTWNVAFIGFFRT